MIDRSKPKLIKHCYAGIWIGYIQSRTDVSAQFYGARISSKNKNNNDEIFKNILSEGINDDNIVGYTSNVEFIYPGFNDIDISDEIVKTALQASEGL